MMSKNGSRRSATLVASLASRNIATVTRCPCNLSHYGFGHHKSENGIVSDSFIKVHPHPVGDDSISSRNVDVKTCRGILCDRPFLAFSSGEGGCFGTKQTDEGKTLIFICSLPYLDNVSLTPLFQFSLQRKLTKKSPYGLPPLRCSPHDVQKRVAGTTLLSTHFA